MVCYSYYSGYLGIAGVIFMREHCLEFWLKCIKINFFLIYFYGFLAFY